MQPEPPANPTPPKPWPPVVAKPILATDMRGRRWFPMKQFGIGQPVRRVEDRRFITGCGTYLDDIERARQAYAFMLRSPHAHARVRAVDTDVAVAVSAVPAVLTG